MRHGAKTFLADLPKKQRLIYIYDIIQTEGNQKYDHKNGGKDMKKRVLILVLLVKPSGLLGKRIQEKV